MNSAKIKVGVFVDGSELPAWQVRMLELVEACGAAEILLAVDVRGNSSDGAGENSGPRRPAVGRASVLRWLLKRIEKVLIGKPGKLPDSTAPVDASFLLKKDNVRWIRSNGNPSRSLSEGQLRNEIAHLAPDVMLVCTSAHIDDSLLDVARFGTWEAFHGLGAGTTDCPFGYFDVIESARISVCGLNKRAPGAGEGKTLYLSYSSTDQFSIVDNLSAMQWKCAHFAARLLQRINVGSPNKDRNSTIFSPRVAMLPLCASEREPLTDAELAQLLWRKFLAKVRRKWGAWARVDQWVLLYEASGVGLQRLDRFNRLSPSTSKMWADPFPIRRNGKVYVFMEEMDVSDNKGAISVLEIAEDGRHSLPTRVIEEPYHLSYPFVFEYQNQTYMVPESAANRTVDLYLCTGFPNDWKHVKTLIRDRELMDATLFEWQGTWWLFANQVETPGISPWDELFLFYSDNPLSENWTPHPNNPVVSDVRSARPAGRLFQRDGKLFRPSQNCSAHYGFGFNICEIVKLTHSEYQEKVVATILPGWTKEIVSTHTYNAVGNMTIIDAQIRN